MEDLTKNNTAEAEKQLTPAEAYQHEAGEVALSGPIRFSDQFAFRFRSSYFGLGGLSYWIITALAAGLLIGYWSKYAAKERVLMILLLCFLVFYLPGSMALRTASFTAQCKAEGIAMDYFVNSTGILAVQGEQSVYFPWEAVLKVKETGKRFFVYTTRRSAFVFAKDVLKEQTDAFKKYCTGGGKMPK